MEVEVDETRLPSQIGSLIKMAVNADSDVLFSIFAWYLLVQNIHIRHKVVSAGQLVKPL